MKNRFHVFKSSQYRFKALLAVILFGLIGNLHAEGSKDFVDYPGHRLFLDTKIDQQLKVYANEGEFINYGSSHLGLSGGFISVYRPDGTLHSTIDDDASGVGVIFNNIQEQAGPTGGGSTNGTGYIPSVVEVLPGQAGVWTLVFDYPEINTAAFTNILNSDAWDRATNQPDAPRVVLAWDISVSANAAGNAGGSLKEGRVYSNEYGSIINFNGTTTSPTFYILTIDGYLYDVDFNETDPFRFPLSSNNLGFVDYTGAPTYASQHREDITRSDDPSSWMAGNIYHYEPQAEDSEDGRFINNKIFFNLPDPAMPATAMTTDIFRNNPHTTWLFSEAIDLDVTLDGFSLEAFSAMGILCTPNTFETAGSNYFYFNSSKGGTAIFKLDLNGDNDFDDAVDRVIYKTIDNGVDSIFWDGLNGEGNSMPVGFDVNINYELSIRGGETHIIMSDVENNMGGVTFNLLNDIGLDNPDYFYYDHSNVEGGISGGGSAGNALPTNEPFTYDSNFGNNKSLDYWAFANLNNQFSGTLVVNIAEDCGTPDSPDSDGDGIPDQDDIDDDNDGIPDLKEYCNPGTGFDCLLGGFDPSHDQDGNGIPNYLDAQDPLVMNTCIDLDANGLCDVVLSVFDTDGDGVPDHLDLDSDNDGITDLVEAGHFQADANGDGIIDGAPADFGLNGLFNPIASDPDDLTAVETYTRWDIDQDGIPDHDDLDSDNDGLNDVLEAGFGNSDTNNDGRIDDGMGNPPVVGKWGLPPVLDPDITGMPIPLPIDNDGDMIPDWHDLDSDNDTIHDVEEGIKDGNDPDDDGIIGTGTPTVNADGQATTDGTMEPLTTTSRPVDTDSDMIPDFHDLDTDNDGINDVAEASVLDDDNDGLPGAGVPMVNQNGVPTGNTGTPIMGTSQPDDTDTDGVRDYRDLDSDNDGINDVLEGGNPDDDTDGFIGTDQPMVNPNGQATSSPDGNPLMTTSNPTNTDGDDMPDFRELDSDNDGISDVIEGGNPDPDFDDIIGTGIPMVNDFGQAFTDEAFIPLNPTSNPTDTDGDGIPDFQELDSDDDGIHDQDECPDDAPCIDGDGDGIPDFQDEDRDNDGISDAYECETSTPCPDTDGDGILDVDDLDTDGDGLLDEFECPGGEPCPDSNSNGIPDWREYLCHAGIVVPDAIIPNTEITVCEGESILLSGQNIAAVEGDVNYSWTGPNDFFVSGTAPLDGNYEAMLFASSFEQSGTYMLQLTTIFGCPAAPVSVQVTVSPKPETPAIDVLDDRLCEGEMLELNSSIYTGNEIIYNWFADNGNGAELIASTNEPTLLIDNTAIMNSGNYSVMVDVDGCASEVSNLQDVTIKAPAIITIGNETNSASPGCENEPVELSAPVFTDATYEWVGPNGYTSNQPNPVIEALTKDTEGDYYVIIRTEYCDIITEPTTVHLYDDIIANDDIFTLAFNETLTGVDLSTNDELGNVNNWVITPINNPANGKITIENGLITYHPNDNFFGVDAFDYEICSADCPEICDIANVQFSISGSDDTDICFIPNIMTPNGDGANDLFQIPCLDDTFMDNRVQIFNRWGDVVHVAEPYKNSWDGTFKGKLLPAGTYFYLVYPEKDGEECLTGYLTITY